MLGLALAWVGLRTLVALKGGNLPRADEIGIDGNVMVYTLLISLLTGLLFGLAPALHFSAENMHENLKEGSRGATGRPWQSHCPPGARRGRAGAGADPADRRGPSGQEFRPPRERGSGFDPDHLLTFGVALPTTRYRSDTAQIAFFDAVLPRIAQIPGIKAAGATSVLPFSGGWTTGSFEVEGYQTPRDVPGPWGDIRIVSPGFFEALRVPLIKGRVLTESDLASSPLVTVVDEEMVRRYWPNDNPIGKRITFGPAPGAADTSSRQWIEVVGVVGHTKHEGLAAEPRVQCYFPYRQSGVPAMMVATRTAGDPESYVNAVRQAVRSVDPDQPISRRRDHGNTAGAVGRPAQALDASAVSLLRHRACCWRRSASTG